MQELQNIPPMHPYQEECVNFILSTPKCGLFLDCGLGKTRVTLEALKRICLTEGIRAPGHILVIGPKPVVMSTWTDEIAKWGYNVTTRSFILNERGKELTAKKRKEMYASLLTDSPAMYFINRDLVADLVKNLPMQGGKRIWPFPIVVCDELQSFKSHDSGRFLALRSVSHCIHRLIGLTGSPTPNGIMDIWAQICLMDNGERLGRYITHFRNEYFHEGKQVNGVTVSWIPKDGAEDRIYDKIRGIVVSMKNTMIKLPELTVNNLYVHMDSRERLAYNTMKREHVIPLTEDDAISAKNAGVLLAKLSQMASGSLYTGEGRNYIRIHNRKLDMLRYIINNTDSPVLVAYYFNNEKDMITEYLAADRQDPIFAEVCDGTPEMIHEWNSGRIRVMLAQPASVGAGINLQQGGHTLVWYTLPQSLENYMQLNARLYRQGQENPVTIHHILTENTVDIKNLARLEKKDSSQQALLDAVSFGLEA